MIDRHFLDFQWMIRNGQKSDSFAAHYEQQFKYTMLCNDQRNHMMSRVVHQINPFGSTIWFTKPDCHLCMEERLTIKNNTWQKCHTYQQMIRDISGLPAQNDFLPIFPEHWWSHHWVKGLEHTIDLNNLYLKARMVVISTQVLLPEPQRLEK